MISVGSNNLSMKYLRFQYEVETCKDYRDEQNKVCGKDLISFLSAFGPWLKFQTDHIRL